MTAIPAVLDYFVNLATTTAAAVSSDWIVSEGWPASLGELMFGVGIDTPPVNPTGEEATGTSAILILGNAGIQEGFKIPHYIYCGSGGADQKACRDAVFSVYTPWLEQLRSDLLTQPSPIPCLIAMVSDVSLTGPKSQEEAAQGRYAVLSFNVACTNIF